MWRLIILFVFMTGCAGMHGPMVNNPSLGAGAVGGAVAAKAAEKIKKVFTPVYPLYLPPHEICDINSSPLFVTCYVVPCKENCTVSYDKQEWFDQNPKVLTVRSSVIPSVIEFCSKNKEACVYYIGEYAGYSIVITED